MIVAGGVYIRTPVLTGVYVICGGILFFHFVNCCKWSSCLFGDLKLEMAVVSPYGRIFLLVIGRKYLSKDIPA